MQLVLGHHSPAFTLATSVHLLPDDLPAPDFLDARIKAVELVREVKQDNVARPRAAVGGAC